MLSITLAIIAGIILLLRQLGIIKNPVLVFTVAAVIVGMASFILKDRINCPFSKKCPFTMCPLNKNSGK